MEISTNPDLLNASSGLIALISEIQSLTNDSNPKNIFPVELLSGLDKTPVTVRFRTGTKLDIPLNLIKRVIGLISTKDGFQSRLFARIEIDNLSPEGRLVCQLASEVEALSQGLVAGSDLNKQMSVTSLGSRDYWCSLYGARCKQGGNITSVYFPVEIKSYSLNSIGGPGESKGVYLLGHQLVGSTRLDIYHDQEGLCDGSSYFATLIVSYVF
jgi:hypothetical protein